MTFFALKKLPPCTTGGHVVFNVLSHSERSDKSKILKEESYKCSRDKNFIDRMNAFFSGAQVVVSNAKNYKFQRQNKNTQQLVPNETNRII